MGSGGVIAGKVVVSMRYYNFVVIITLKKTFSAPKTYALVILAGVIALCIPLVLLVFSTLGWLINALLGEFPDIGLGYVLQGTLLSSLLLLMLVLVLTSVLGVGLAWLMSQYQFFGKSGFEFLLLAPLAVPSFVSAHAWTQVFSYSGVLPSLLRQWGWGDGFFEVRGIVGAACILSLSLYPYVYSLARVAFAHVAITDQGCRAAAVVLGASGKETFWRVIVPMSWPAIAVGLSLVGMETLADYGAVSYLGVDTFTVSIYKTWFGSDQKPIAFALVTSLLACVAVLLMTQRYLQGGLTRFKQKDLARSVALTRLLGLKAAMAWVGCMWIALLGFLFPLGRLLWVLSHDTDAQLGWVQWQKIVSAVVNSVYVSTFGAMVVMGIAVSVALVQWTGNASRMLKLGVGFARLGYATPGVAVAMALLWPIASLDHALADGLSKLLGRDVGLLLMGSLLVLVYAYALRFFAVAYGSLEQGFDRLQPNSYHAALSLGASNWQAMTQVLWPAIRTSVFAGFVLVWMDCLKELPATLMLRPFNFDTLPVLTYQWVADERAAQAALPSLLLVLLGLLPIGFLKRVNRSN